MAICNTYPITTAQVTDIRLMNHLISSAIHTDINLVVVILTVFFHVIANHGTAYASSDSRNGAPRATTNLITHDCADNAADHGACAATRTFISYPLYRFNGTKRTVLSISIVVGC
jgi:hypothetical protein